MQTLTKLNIEAWRPLKMLAAEQDKPVTELQVEGLNLLFRKYGKPEIALRWTPGGE